MRVQEEKDVQSRGTMSWAEMILREFGGVARDRKEGQGGQEG